MNAHLQRIFDLIKQSAVLSTEDKLVVEKAIKDTAKEMEILSFKLDRTEKVKHTTAVLLEETIEELEQKRKAVEAQNRELEVESSLERVRTVALSMNKRDDMLLVCRMISNQLELLNVKEIRNIQTAIFYEEKGIYSNFEYYALHDKLLVTEVEYKNHPMSAEFANEMLSGPGKVFIISMEGKELKDWYAFQKTTNQFADTHLEIAASLNYYWFSLGPVALGISTYAPLKEEDIELFKRFRNVFELAYRRFLDIKQAEEQAREVKIELALERVRARTMAMQRSNELSETAQILFQQFKDLGETPIQITIGIFDEEAGIIDFNVTDWGGAGSQIARTFNASIEEPTLMRKIYKAWKANQKSVVIDLTGQELLDWVAYRNSMSGTTDHQFKLHDRRVVHVGLFSKGLLSFSTHLPRPAESVNVLERFASVFDQTYTRFLDLKKLEAQAREAQIEAVLERVRSRTMAMHNSEELSEVAYVVFQQFKVLGFEPAQFTIGIINELQNVIEYWHTWEGKQLNEPVKVPLDEPYVANKIYKSWKEKKKSAVIDLSGKELREYNIDRKKHLKKVHITDADAILDEEKRRIISLAYFSKGSISISTHELPPAETIQFLQRFAAVFEQTYTRFLDLQKAEAQTREAQIEASLERVRTKAMSMHSSDDLSETVKVYFKELKSLGMVLLRCGVAEYGDEPYLANITVTSATAQGDSFQILGRVKQIGHPVLEGIYEHWLRQEEFFPVLKGKDLHAYNQVISSKIDLPDLPEDAIQYGYYFYFKEGSFFVWAQEKLSDDSIKLFRRFTSVLSLTYRRYLDLVEAETQAKEAIIDAALEKVRGRAMAMHNSSDLSSTAAMVFTELRKLGIVPIRSGVGLLTKENRKANIYAATSGEEGDALSLVGWVMLEGNQVLAAQYESWLQQEDFFPSLKGAELKSYYENLTPNFSLPEFQTDDEEHGYYLPFRDGFLYCWTDQLYSETQIKILNRFKSIIDLTFRRYVELQKSEANARDAVRQASLDRVRAEIASMRTTRDLEKITPLIWNELSILGVPFIRCGVFIMDEALQLIHTFLSTPEGNAIAAFHLPFTSPGNIAQVLTNWKKNEYYIDHWDEAAFKEFAGILVKEGALTSPEQYLSTMPKGGFYLHFLPFLQGMFYVGNTNRLSEDEINLVQSVADAFSTAYARYEDFNKLESAKQQVENTLSDLKQAQQQLIQAEKMASLGELTAGIAHEIQNPLNFVNNFSEVNTELVEELKQEIVKGNLDEVKAIANDIKDNQEKITHHGKRADAIVKGMLQHSRTSSGVKEPTDINVLADEYLRLAYHGLRAKDKSFNATMKTDFDPNIGLINIIPQDIGRVILNLITNAFYAVSEKKKLQPDGYEPIVSVSTKKTGDAILISVRDNGNGIPKNVLDKIFQPFFTTKPTGQGTGLGLSLSYDIVKAHGGELKVVTNEGEGTTFIIQLPISA